MDEWYTNRDLFEQIQGLRTDMSDLRSEMASLQAAIRARGVAWRDVVSWGALLIAGLSLIFGKAAK